MCNNKSAVDITESEWYVLDVLWDHSPRTAKELTDVLKNSIGWSRSTTLTMLRRMTEKGLLICEKESAQPQMYYTMLSGDEVRLRETEHFLKRVYRGSISMMLSAMTDGNKLSDTEIAELYEVLHQAEQKK